MSASATIYLQSPHTYKFPRPVNDGKENAIKHSFRLNDNTVLYIVEVLEIYITNGIRHNSSEYKLRKYKTPKYVIKAILNDNKEDELKMIHQILTTSEIFKTYNAALEMLNSIKDKHSKDEFEINLI